ncbi:pyridine nucleotide-disulfide oxidoreductase [Rubrobacter xylanophilus]|uniref:Pyridine nucleotide-disulfide oxidoreductase n=1 Tax=Rubrobacter xylanophilus TaxID=49319 RepID=A0A510HF48_9ACTN|nr:NAD(P)/FAD-dependent oxidoreductase [Rubrobacter xylanophilus]BBL78566.1 pyridine nucleotide-disulfide oxidoreductase [Rubrobacter xylanophilus]
MVVGAGLAGTHLARSLPPALRRPGETLVVDRSDRYVFAPLIHEVAAGRLHPDSVTLPVVPALHGRCGFLRAEVTGVDLEGKLLLTSRGEISYEYLVLAPGSDPLPPPENLAPHLMPFHTLEDALRLRDALAAAWREHSRGPSPSGLTVAVAGGGTTGVELAAELAILSRYLRRRAGRHQHPGLRVVLLEAGGRLMSWLDPYFHRVALEELVRMGVEVRLHSPVEDASEEGVLAGGRWLPARIRIWTAGVRASRLIRELPVPQNDAGRAKVGPHLTLTAHPEVYVLGDAALREDPQTGPLPPTGSVAVQQGPYAARDVWRRLRGSPRPPFRFVDRGYAVSLGPQSAVASPFGRRIRGAPAQALYRSALLYYLRGRRQRLLAASDWAMEKMGRLGFP